MCMKLTYSELINLKTVDLALKKLKSKLGLHTFNNCNLYIVHIIVT